MEELMEFLPGIIFFLFILRKLIQEFKNTSTESSSPSSSKDQSQKTDEEVSVSNDNSPTENISKEKIKERIYENIDNEHLKENIEIDK